MGGNGAYAKYLMYALDTYHGERFKEVGHIGEGKNRVSVVTSATKKTDSTPMNSFESLTYYVVKPGDHSRITTIAFYDKRSHRIKKSIDLKYDKKGNLLEYKVVIRKGRKHTIGSHWHKWSLKNKKNAGRKSHDSKNVYALTKAEKQYIKKALSYNAKQTKS